MTPQEREQEANRLWAERMRRATERRITPLQATLLGFRRHADDRLHAELSVFIVSISEARPEPREWR